MSANWENGMIQKKEVKKKKKRFLISFKGG